MLNFTHIRSEHTPIEGVYLNGELIVEEMNEDLGEALLDALAERGLITLKKIEADYDEAANEVTFPETA